MGKRKKTIDQMLLDEKEGSWRKGYTERKSNSHDDTRKYM